MTNSDPGPQRYGPTTGHAPFKKAEELEKQGNKPEAKKYYNQAAEAYDSCGDKANADKARNKANSL